MNKQKELYEMRLHERISLPGSEGGVLLIRRVPGGWLYAEFDPGGDGEPSRHETMCFVPFSLEFAGGRSATRPPRIDEGGFLVHESDEF